jgi:hypothetical protein
MPREEEKIIKIKTFQTSLSIVTFLCKFNLPTYARLPDIRYEAVWGAHCPTAQAKGKP